jgi:hypothetical protein
MGMESLPRSTSEVMYYVRNHSKLVMFSKRENTSCDSNVNTTIRITYNKVIVKKGINVLSWPLLIIPGLVERRHSAEGDACNAPQRVNSPTTVRPCMQVEEIITLDN